MAPLVLKIPDELRKLFMREAKKRGLSFTKLQILILKERYGLDATKAESVPEPTPEKPSAPTASPEANAPDLRALIAKRFRDLTSAGRADIAKARVRALLAEHHAQALSEVQDVPALIETADALEAALAVATH